MLKADGNEPSRYWWSEDFDGDFVIVNSQKRNVISGDVVLAVIDDRATIKRLIHYRANNQIVLMADSSFDYAPIYLHPEDDFIIAAKQSR